MQTEQNPGSRRLLIGLVGPCSAGKSTLAQHLRAAGYEVREIRQEHSVVPTMWQRITDPDVLVYLDVTQQAAAEREGLASPSSWWTEEREVRLAHARQHCDLYVDTTHLDPDQVASRVLAHLSGGETPGVA